MTADAEASKMIPISNLGIMNSFAKVEMAMGGI